MSIRINKLEDDWSPWAVKDQQSALQPSALGSVGAKNRLATCVEFNKEQLNEQKTQTKFRVKTYEFKQTQSSKMKVKAKQSSDATVSKTDNKINPNLLQFLAKTDKNNLNHISISKNGAKYSTQIQRNQLFRKQRMISAQVVKSLKANQRNQQFARIKFQSVKRNFLLTNSPSMGSLTNIKQKKQNSSNPENVDILKKYSVCNLKMPLTQESIYVPKSSQLKMENKKRRQESDIKQFRSIISCITYRNGFDYSKNKIKEKLKIKKANNGQKHILDRLYGRVN